MNDALQDMEILIAKHLCGEISAAESATLDAWRRTDPANERYFQELQRLWALAPQADLAHAAPLSVESALEKVKAQIARQSQAPALTVRSSRRLWLQAAAAVAALLIAAYLFFRPSTPPAPQEIAADNSNILTDTLSDGSVVTLNRASGLQLAGSFNQKERRLRLHGEAFFEVSKNAEKPFIVETSGLEVIVVGTAFNVDETERPGQVLVSVEEGKVRLRARDSSLLLTAGEAGLYDIQSGQLSRLSRQNGLNPGAYKNRIFQFEGTSLSEVVRQLNKAYGANIRLGNPELEKCTLTARYNNLPLDRVLQLIAESFSFKTTRVHPNEWVIDGTGCN
jgi:transmembrane sensor